MDKIAEFENKIYPEFRTGYQEALLELNRFYNIPNLFKPDIEKNNYKKIVEKIKHLEKFTLQSAAIEQLKLDWWKEYLESTMSEENGKISLINFEGQEVIFDSIEDVYEKFIKIKNEKIWAPYHNTFTRIFVELTVEYIINACECVPIQTSIEFLRKSISHIQKEQSLDKYARRKLNDHLKYYKTILQISLKDTTGNKKLYKGEHLYSAIVQNNKLFLLQKQLNDLNFDTFFSLIKSIYASIPYNLISSKESYFHSIFHVITVLLIQSIKSEELTSLGRIDSIIELNEKVFIFEFKLNDINQAIEQIRERRYYEKYQQLNKIIFMIGVSFDSKTKNIKEWRVEKI